MTKLILRYSHNIIEHLGLKLYQNRPTRVIAELVSNSWDADAGNVWVDLEMGEGDRWVAVADDGTGMTRHDLAGSYLVVGHPKRTKPEEKSSGGRALMGRKGIGKLAAFGIAGSVDLITYSAVLEEEERVHWLRFALSEMLAGQSGNGIYEPEVVAVCSDLSGIPLARDPTGAVSRWSKRVEHRGAGTLVLMRNLSIKRALSKELLLSSLGRRFTVSIRDDFQVRVNGDRITAGNGLPAVEFRIPDSGWNLETLGEQQVRWWAGFVEKADWPADEAGVGVYAHGKIAQDRPFTFGVRGKEIYTRYLFAVVEADWLDELDSDLISTDRTNIDWTADATEELHSWGAARVREWVGKFESWRKSREQGENRARVEKQAKAGGPKVSEAEQEQIVNLLSELTPALGKDEAAKEEAAKVLSEAWTQAPMRKLVTDLWNEIGRDGIMPPAAFTKTIERLSRSSVPESLNLAVVFAQRAFALSRLHEYVLHGREPDLQSLIERFPWIIEPDMAVVTANQSLRTAVQQAEARGEIPTGRRTIVGGTPDSNRPDFVFLSSPDEKAILVVELKSPQEDLTIDNRIQLEDYMNWFMAHYPRAELRGVLVGRNPSDLTSPRRDVKVIPWTRVLERSRGRNLELLAAMLVTSAEVGSGDSRVAAAMKLGGDDALALLKRMAKDHDDLRELMDSFPSVLTTTSGPL